MVNLDAQIRNLQEKIQLLAKQQVQLVRDNQRLQKDLESARQKLAQSGEENLRLQQQMDILKLGSGALSEAEKTALSKRIDSYLREIDKCLALLNT
jgi:predicted nuclease with TOPRIM domain